MDTDNLVTAMHLALAVWGLTGVIWYGHTVFRLLRWLVHFYATLGRNED